MAELGKIEQLTGDVKEYLTTNLEIVKLQATERTSVIGSGLLTGLIIGGVGFIFLLFLSFGGAFYLSDLFESNYIGFVLVSGFYLLISIVLIIGKKKLLRNPLRDMIIRMILGNK